MGKPGVFPMMQSSFQITYKNLHLKFLASTKPVLCDNLEGGMEREVRGRGHMCTDGSFMLSVVETTAILCSNYPPVKNKIKFLKYALNI